MTERTGSDAATGGGDDIDATRRAALRGALAAPLAAGALIGQADAVHAQAGTLVVGITGTARHLNHGVASGMATMVPGAQLFASPLRFDEGWTPQPYLAESWSVQDDGRSLLLRLREGATFHDGRPITSEDVAFSIMAIRANHPFSSMFEPVQAVDTPSPRIAVIRLAKPHPALLLALSPAFCPIMPKHVFGDGRPLRTHPANTAPVGSGPFRLVEFKPNEHIVFERHAGFFLKDRPRVDRMVMRAYPDPSNVVTAFNRKEIHYMPWVYSLAAVDQLEKLPHVRIDKTRGEAIGPLGWVAFNLTRKPFDDVRVRQAIAWAVDRDFIVKRLQRGYTEVATGPIAPRTPFYAEPAERFRLNLERANQLLDAAGLKRGDGGMRLQAQLDFLPGTPDYGRDLAEYLRPQLRKIGIEVRIRTSPDFATYAQRIAGFDFDMTVDGAFNYGDPVIGVHRTYLSSNIRKGVMYSNTQNYANPRVDDLLARATVERDEGKRKRLYAEFQQIVRNDLPLVFLSTWAITAAADRSIKGVPTSIWNPVVPLDTVSLG